MRWARMSPEQISEISALAAPQAARVLREAIAGARGGVRCQGCWARFAVIGDLAAADNSPCPQCAGRLEIDW